MSRADQGQSVGPKGQGVAAELRDVWVEFPAVGQRRSGRAGLRPVAAVAGVSAEIAVGETVGLVGESGSGKTTLARCLLGLVRPSHGQVVVAGCDVHTGERAQIRALRARMQVVFQDPAGSLNPRMTVERLITEPLKIHGEGGRAERRKRACSVLEMVGLKPTVLVKHPHEFSGGQRQRIAIARALVLEPSFVIWDEPTSALDVSVQAQILNLLVDLQARLGLTCLFISHDLAVIRQVARRVLVMRDGRVVEAGAVDEVFVRPAHPYTRELLRAVPVHDPGPERLPERKEEELPLLRVDGLSARIEGSVIAVDDVSFTVGAGSRLGIIGESGSGKTATALSVLRLLDSSRWQMDARALEFVGRDVLAFGPKDLQQLRGGQIAFIPQNPMNSLNPSMRVGDQLAAIARLHQQVSRADARAMTLRALAEVGLSAKEYRAYPHELSGGMRQRALIGMAVLCRARLLIADEPTSALDVTTQATILNLLIDVSDRFDLAVMLITHDLGVAAGFCESLLVMYGGRVVEKGSVQDLLLSPRHPYTRSLLGSTPRLDVRRDRLASIPGTQPVRIKKARGCCFQDRCWLRNRGDLGVDPVRCDSEQPALRSTSGGMAACHYADADLTRSASEAL